MMLAARHSGAGGPDINGPAPEHATASAEDSRSAGEKATRNRSWRSVAVAAGSALRPRTCRGTALNNNEPWRTSHAGKKRGRYRDCSWDLSISWHLLRAGVP